MDDVLCKPRKLLYVREIFLVHVGEITSTRTRKYCFLNAFAKVRHSPTALTALGQHSEKIFI